MNIDPWIIDPNQNQPRKYVLNSQDRLYCANENCGSYREAKLRRRIREDSIEEFPKRIQDLIDDIMLVEYADEDFLNSDEWDKLWSKIIAIEQRSTAITDEEILRPIDSSNEVQFGFELGQSLSVLRSNELPVEPLVWGVLQGLLSSGAEDIGSQIQAIEEMMTKFQNRMAERRQRAESKQSDEQSIADLSGKIEDEIDDCLRANGIEATAKTIGITNIFVDKVIHGGENYNLEEDIQSFIEQRDVSAIDGLRQQLEEDTEIVINKSKQGVPVYDVLNYMHRRSRASQFEGAEKEIERRKDENENKRDKKAWEDILSEFEVPPMEERNKKEQQRIPPEYAVPSINKSEFPFTSKKYHMLVAALKQLSNMADGGLNTNKPVIEKVKNRWKLTPYGSLLSDTVFEQEDSTWVYTYSINPHDLQVQQKHMIEESLSLE